MRPRLFATAKQLSCVGVLRDSCPLGQLSFGTVVLRTIVTPHISHSLGDRVTSPIAIADGRSLFRKGANFTAATAFEMASTNLVVELSIIMLAFLGWQLTLAEFIGAPIMVGLLIFLFRRFLNRELLEQAKV